MVKTIRTPVFSRYEVLERIGSGGMGTVYRAHDRNLDRLVALKVLTPGLQAHAEALERFRREARALACLKHPSVAAVYDADVEGGFPYLVMEFVEGESLEQLLRSRERLNAEEVIRIGQQLTEALAHIHQHGIIHRDLKASNVIIGPHGRAVLADFGIALVASLPRISQGALGTPEYMSPEQADGEPLDGRSDLYSLGVVLYECLTGIVPFERDGESLVDLAGLMKHVLEDPVPPVRAQNPDVPGWLAAVVERCLEKQPQARFASADEVAEALRQERATLAADTTGDGHRSLAPAVAATSGTAAYGRSHIADAGRKRRLERATVLTHTQPVVTLAFSPEGRHIASAAADGMVRLWDVSTGRLLHTLDARGDNALSVAFSADSRYLASGHASGAIHLWDARTGQHTRALDGHHALAMSVAFHPSDMRLASGGADGLVYVWDVRTGTPVQVLSGHVGYVLSVAFSSEGRYLASGGADGAVRLWEAATGRLHHVLREHDGWVISVAFSPDVAVLASSGADGTVRLWEAHTGRVQRVMRGHRAWVMGAGFSPDGARLVSACRDHAVRVFDVKDGHLVHIFDHHTDAVMAAAYDPGGRHLASGSKDGTIRLWPVQPVRTVRRLPARALLGTLALLLILALGIWFAQITSDPWIDPAARAALYGEQGIPPSRPGWTMIVASPTDHEEAERIASRLQKKGYRVGIFESVSNGVVHFRVGVGHFPEHAQARAMRDRLAGRHLPADAWVVRLRGE